MQSSRSCLSIDELARYVAGMELTGGRVGLDAHVDSCDRCQAEVVATVRARRGAVGTDPTLPGATALGSGSQSAPSASDASEPKTIGKFAITRRLGAGAMGVVYLATDPDLHRQVALKVVQSALTGVQARARMLREAQAMAQLDHPNVVRVYEVGEAATGDLYIAMEYVDGTTLSDWLSAEQRPWRAVISAFEHAGRGLAAAHAVGLVHRDFKPDNVLVDRAGNVKVGDFGLARAADAIADAPSGSPALATLMTNEGAVIGTPIYMAPEQLEGELATARSDQFAWCVAFYEATYGARPFSGSTLAALGEATREGPREPRAAGSRAALWPVLRRGLAADPAARFDDVPALLRAVSRAVTARRRSVVVTSVAAAAVVAASLVTPNDLIGERAASVWSSGRAASLATAMQHASKRPAAYVADQAARATKRIDGFLAGWLTARRSIEPTAEPGVRRCFARSLGALDQWLVLANQAAMIDDLVTSLDMLPDPARCLIAQSDSPPTDRAAELAGIVDALAIRTAHGEVGGVSARLDPLMAEIRTLGWPGLLASALDLQADVASERSDSKTALADLEEAFRIAPGSDVRLRMRLLSALVHLTATVATDLPAADHWGGEIDRVVTRARADKLPAAELAKLDSLAMALHAELAIAHGDLAGALAIQKRALDVTRTAYGEHSLRYADAEVNIGHTLMGRGAVDEATPYYERGIALMQEALGANHPRVAHELESFAAARLTAADFAGARAKFDAALAIETAAYGPDDVHQVNALIGLGNLDLNAGKLDSALAFMTKAIDVTRAARGNDAVDLIEELTLHGYIRLQLGDLPAARKEATEALAIAVGRFGKSNRRVVAVRDGLAMIEMAGGNYPAARAVLEENEGAGDDTSSALYLGSLDLAEGKLEAARDRFHRLTAALKGDSDPLSMMTLGGEGRALVGLHRERDALPLLVRAEAQLRARGASGAEPAATRIALARAELAVHHDRKRVLELVRLAREDFAAGENDPDARAVRFEIAPFVASLGLPPI